MKQGFLHKVLRYAYLHGYKYRATERAHARLVKQVQAGSPFNVVFMAMNVAMWRYQRLWELMNADERFNVSIVLSPCIDYDRQQSINELKKLRAYFEERNMPYVDYDLEHDAAPVDIRKELDPLVMFYPQPYEHLLTPEHDCMAFYDRLICYYPYAFWTSKGKWSYDFHFHNLAWRLYYSTALHLKEAQITASNKGRNVRVVGYPNADDYLNTSFTDVWKPSADGQRRMRIVWAPHYSITEQFGLVPRSNFLWMAGTMLDLATKYADKIQLAFKPHPRLLTELYKHPDWGKEKTDAYYAQWQSGTNTQLETGGFIDLFMTSDAMIHDSGSFAVEYHYSRKPAMFVSRDLDSILATQSEFGILAYDMHYIGATDQDIESFVTRVVIDGEDSLKQARDKFYNDYLLPPGGQSVAQNTVDDLVRSLDLK